MQHQIVAAANYERCIYIQHGIQEARLPQR